MANALAKLAKELICFDNKYIFIEVKKFYILTLISLDFNDFDSPVGELAIIKYDSKLD